MKLFSKKFIFTKLKKGRAVFLRFQFTKQFIFVAVAVVALVVGGILIFAVNGKGAPLVAYWKFDEGSASSTYDSSGNANTGTLYGGVQWANGVYGSALQFDGVNDYVKTTINFSNGANAPITLEAWVNSNVITNDGAFSRRIILPGGNQYFSLTLSSGKLTAYYYNGSQLELSDSVVVSAGAWYHVVGAYDGTTMRLYVNGILKNSVVTTLNAITLGLIRIGIYSDDTNGKWNGLIDDVRIYNYARTTDQVRADYNANSAFYLNR